MLVLSTVKLLHSITIRDNIAWVDSRDSFRKLPTGAIAFVKLVYEFNLLSLRCLFLLKERLEVRSSFFFFSLVHRTFLSVNNDPNVWIFSESISHK